MAKPTNTDNLVTEKELQESVRELADLYGWETYHQVTAVFCPHCRKPTFSKRVGPGFPDLVMVHPNGRLIFAELKRQKGTVDQEQADWLRLLNTGKGREVYLWRPSDLDAIVQILQPDHDASPGETLVLPVKYMTPSRVDGPDAS